MHKILFDYITKTTGRPLTTDETRLLQDAFIPKKFRKHQYLLQEGDICRMAGFVVKGAFRQYTVDDKGKEHMVSLCIENWWVGDRESFIKETPSPYFIDAWEASETLLFSKENGKKVLELPLMQELISKLTERQAFALLRRVNTSLSLTAEQRLAELEKTNPEFFQRFPQHIIASYLGMTKETLSRIRSNSQKK